MMNRTGTDQGGRGLIEVIYQNIPGGLKRTTKASKTASFSDISTSRLYVWVVSAKSTCSVTFLMVLT
jgi:hypothetical protein